MNELLSKRLDALLIIIAVLSVVTLAILSSPYGRSDHVDTFWFARLYQDLFLDQGSLADWYFAPVPNYFPEITLYFAISSLGMSFEFTTLAYVVTIFLLTFLLAFDLTTRLVSDQKKVFALVVAIFFSLLLIALGEDLTNWSRNTIHYGTFFNLLLVVLLLQRSVDSSRVVPWALPLFLSIALGSMSDFLFLPIFFSGMLGWLTCAYSLAGLSRAKLITIAVSTFFGLCVGVLLYFQITPNAYENPVWASGLSLREVFSNIGPHRAAVQFMWDHLWSRPYIFFTVLFLAASSLFLSLPVGAKHRQLLPLSTFILLGILANIYIFGLGAESSALNRYTVFATNISLLVVALASALVFAYLSRPISKPFVYRLFLFLAILTCGGLVISGETRSENTKDKFTSQLDTVRCIERVASNRGLQSGIADYDWATRLTVLSEGLLYLWPVRGNSLEFLPWLATKNGWENRQIGFVVTRTNIDHSVYQFKRLTYPLAEDMVRDWLGSPVASASCDDLKILFYR